MEWKHNLRNNTKEKKRNRDQLPVLSARAEGCYLQQVAAASPARSPAAISNNNMC